VEPKPKLRESNLYGSATLLGSFSKLSFLRQFTFSSSLARMSVIVRNLSSNSFIVFAKGIW
jgi:magnesium-transporting ATPase (P-type)